MGYIILHPVISTQHLIAKLLQMFVQIPCTVFILAQSLRHLLEFSFPLVIILYIHIVQKTLVTPIVPDFTNLFQKGIVLLRKVRMAIAVIEVL